MRADEATVAILALLAFLALGRMLMARAGIGRDKPDCGCGDCGGRRAKRAE